MLSGKEKENDFPSDERSEVEGNTLSFKLSALGHKSRLDFNSMENFNTNKLRKLTINTEKYFYHPCFSRSVTIFEPSQPTAYVIR